MAKVDARTEIRRLGPVEVKIDGRPLDLPPSNKTLALFAYLVVTGREHTRTSLSSLLWEDVADPRGSLRWCLSKLRPLVDGDGVARLVAQRDVVAIDVRDLRVDLLEAREAVRASDHAPVDDLADVASRFRGPFLEGIDLPDCPRFHAWCVAEREDARVLQAKLLDAIVRRSRAEAPERALEFARRRVDLDPNDEGAEADVIELLVALDRHAEADERFRAAQHRLAQAGRRPGPRLVAARAARRAPVTAPEPAPPDATATESASPSVPPQEIRFATASDGAAVAFSTAGSGPPIVKTANWLNHLEYEWSSPVWRHWLVELTRHHRLLRYDARGTGLSGREGVQYSFEALVGDLEAVLRAASIERCSILGISQGAAVAVAYAAAHPEAVERLVLIGGFARGWRSWGAKNAEAGEAMGKLVAQGWGRKHAAFRQLFTSLFFPEASQELAADFNELQRRATSAEHAAAILEVLGTLDVTHLLSQVRAPTLVVHARRDGLVPFAEGQRIATGIPGARFLPLESENHLLLESEPAWPRFVEELRRFLG